MSNYFQSGPIHSFGLIQPCEPSVSLRYALDFKRKSILKRTIQCELCGLKRKQDEKLKTQTAQNMLFSSESLRI